jgi:type IV fimbrial biogenesis protein FimT
MLMLHHKPAAGFSLVELMIAIAVFSILIMLGAPSFTSWMQSSQIRTAAESIVDGLQLARAEAVRLNANVQFSLTSSSGLVDWQVCSAAAATAIPCPTGTGNLIQQRSNTEGSVNARVGVYEENDGNNASSYSTVVAAGNEMPTHVTFNGLGRAVTDGSDDTVRIDVTNVKDPNARRLIILVNYPGGQIRMCDPALPSTDPKAC